jgi:hypothetical protein
MHCALNVGDDTCHTSDVGEESVTDDDGDDDCNVDMFVVEADSGGSSVVGVVVVVVFDSISGVAGAASSLVDTGSLVVDFDVVDVAVDNSIVVVGVVSGSMDEVVLEDDDSFVAVVADSLDVTVVVVVVVDVEGSLDDGSVT